MFNTNPFRNVIDLLLHLIVRLIITGVLYTGLLLFLKGYTHLYNETHVGALYKIYFAERVRMTSELMILNPISTSLELVFFAFKYCLLLSIISQLLTITRRFYLSLGFFTQLLIWGPVCTSLAAYNTMSVFDIKLTYGVAFSLTLIPTLALLHGTFHFSSELFPELPSLFSRGTKHPVKTFS